MSRLGSDAFFCISREDLVSYEFYWTAIRDLIASKTPAQPSVKLCREGTEKWEQRLQTITGVSSRSQVPPQNHCWSQGDHPGRHVAFEATLVLAHSRQSQCCKTSQSWGALAYFWNTHLKICLNQAGKGQKLTCRGENVDNRVHLFHRCPTNSW